MDDEPVVLLPANRKTGACFICGYERAQSPELRARHLLDEHGLSSTDLLCQECGHMTDMGPVLHAQRRGHVPVYAEDVRERLGPALAAQPYLVVVRVWGQNESLAVENAYKLLAIWPYTVGEADERVQVLEGHDIRFIPADLIEKLGQDHALSAND